MFDEYQQKIELASHDVKSSVRANLTGWGRPSANISGDSVQLQKLSTTLLTSVECQQYYPKDRVLYEDQLCALGAEGTGACRVSIISIAKFFHSCF